MPALHWLTTAILSVALALARLKSSPCMVTPAAVQEENRKREEHVKKRTREGKKKGKTIWQYMPDNSIREGKVGKTL